MKTLIIYKDGELVIDSYKKWLDAPRFDVVLIAQPGHLPPGGDFYYMEESQRVYHSSTPRSLYRRFHGDIPLGTNVEESLEMDPRIKCGVTVEDLAFKAAEARARQFLLEECNCG